MNAEHKRKGRRLMRRFLELLRDGKNALLGAGALAGAVVAIFSAVTTLLPKGSRSHPQPTAIEASIEEADVEPDVLLTRYEYTNQPAALGNASYERPPQAGAYRLAVYVTSSTPTNSAAIQGAGSSTTSTTGGEAIKEEPKAKEEPTAAEAAKAREELEIAEDEATKAKVAEEVKAREETVLKAAAKVRAAEEARLRKKEATKIRREEQEEATAKKVKPAGGGRSKQSHAAGGETTSVPAFAKPPASPTPLHREGNARVLVGTGASTSQVDVVLAKVKALLRKERAGLRRNADLTESGLPFSAEDPVFTGAAANESIGESSASSLGVGSAAKLVPSRCDTACGLRPTIDKAIADNSSNLAEAAREVAAAFTESRVQVFEHKPQPIGVIVDYKVHFVGFAGKRMILEWTLCSKSTGRPLPRTWWRNVIVKQFVPKIDGYRTSGNFWAPVPPAPGDYYFRLRVFEGSTEPAHKETGLFH